MTRTQDEVTFGPGWFAADGHGGELELVIPYTDNRTTLAALERAAAMLAGLNARILLVAVHTLPYPQPFNCPSAVHAHLVSQLVEISYHCPLPVQPQVVLARDIEEGFRYALKPSSTVLLATRRGFWRSREERLARMLSRDGHKVALLQLI